MWTRFHYRYTFLLSIISFPIETVLAHGNFGKCCDVIKCKQMVSACRNSQMLVGGRNCTETCLTDNHHICKSHTPTYGVKHEYRCFRAFLKDHSVFQKKCDQSYRADLTPAPGFYISCKQCRDNCWPFARSDWKDTEVWATPLVQYILPAVIFSMNIPRSVRLAIPEHLFDFGTDTADLVVFGLRSLVLAGITVTLDTIIWVCFVFSTAGLMIVGGLHEAVLDLRLIDELGSPRWVKINKREKRLYVLSHQERIDVMIVILCGNLDPDVGQARNIIRQAMMVGAQAERPRVRTVEAQIRALLTSQYSFGQTVGAPVVFYLGSFFFSSSLLNLNKGKNATAHGLAFGLWWMAIVHVAIVSGCVLASNNPSTVVAVVSPQLGEQNLDDTNVMRVGGRHRSAARRWAWLSFAEGIQWPHWAPQVTTVYDTLFEPAVMWNRGVTKRQWLEGITEEWAPENREQFRRNVEIMWKTWVWIGLFAVTIIFVPSFLAGFVSYHTPRQGISCRSLTFMIYGISQIILIVANIVRCSFEQDLRDMLSMKEPSDTDSESIDSNHMAARTYSFRSISTALMSYCLIFFSAMSLIGAVFTTTVSTLWQMMGFMGNCICALSWQYWLQKSGQLIQIAQDTDKDRESSKYWTRCAYAGMGIMAGFCYFGWWYQRKIRSNLLERLEELELSEVPPAGLGAGHSNNSFHSAPESLNAGEMENS